MFASAVVSEARGPVFAGAAVFTEARGAVFAGAAVFKEASLFDFLSVSPRRPYSRRAAIETLLIPYFWHAFAACSEMNSYSGLSLISVTSNPAPSMIDR